MLENGYVTLPRSLAKKEWFYRDNILKLYIMLLFNAAFKDTETGGVPVKRGQYLTSLRKLAEMTHTSVQQVRTALKHLESAGEITIQTTSKYRVISLNNALSETPFTQSDNNLANKLADKADHTRSSKAEEEKSIEEKSGKEEAATSPPADRSCGINFSLITREELIKKYGEDTVAFYEKKFYGWAKGKSAVSARLYPTIAKWMAEDVPHAPKSTQSSYPSKLSAPSESHAPHAPDVPKAPANGGSINIALLKERIMESYRKQRKT